MADKIRNPRDRNYREIQVNDTNFLSILSPLTWNVEIFCDALWLSNNLQIFISSNNYQLNRVQFPRYKHFLRFFALRPESSEICTRNTRNSPSKCTLHVHTPEHTVIRWREITMEIDSRYRRLLPTRRKVIQGLSTRSTPLIRPTSGEGGWDIVCSNCLNQFEWSLWRNWAGLSFASKGTCYVSRLIVSLNDALMTGCLDVYHDHISSINYYFVRSAHFFLQD